MTLTLYVKYLRGEKQGQFCLQDLVLVQTNELYLKTLKGNGQKKTRKGVCRRRHFRGYQSPKHDTYETINT